MYLSDIITQLRKALPINSDKFSEKVAISTITFSGGTVTVVTASAHDLETGDQVTIVDAKQKTPITSITETADIATITTSIAHDQTLDHENSDDQPDITIAGVTISGYNGDFAPITIPDRNTITYNVGATLDDANDGYILENSVDGYSGQKTITVIDTTTFTFSASGLAAEGSGGFVHHTIRISGEISIERMLDVYTKQNPSDWWAIVVPGDIIASKDRHTGNDSTATPTAGDENRQKIITPFSIFYVVPTKDKIGVRERYDSIILDSVALFMAILGFAPPSPYSITSFSKVILEGHGFFDYNRAYYIHEFKFSITDELIADDLNMPSDGVAFRDIDFDIINENDVIIMDNTLKTDEE